MYSDTNIIIKYRQYKYKHNLKNPKIFSIVYNTKPIIHKLHVHVIYPNTCKRDYSLTVLATNSTHMYCVVNTVILLG